MIQLPIGSRPHHRTDFGHGFALGVLLDEFGVAMSTTVQAQVAGLGNHPLVVQGCHAIEVILDARVKLTQRHALRLGREK